MQCGLLLDEYINISMLFYHKQTSVQFVFSDYLIDEECKYKYAVK